MGIQTEVNAPDMILTNGHEFFILTEINCKLYFCYSVFIMNTPSHPHPPHIAYWMIPELFPVWIDGQ